MDLYQKEENFKQREADCGQWSEEGTEDQQHEADQKTWNVDEDEKIEGEECLYLPHNQESRSCKMFRYGQLRSYKGITVSLHFLI